MKKKKVVQKKIVISNFEKLIYAFALVFLLLEIVGVVFSQATLSKVNYDVERTKKTISTQEKKNEGLTMKINELASLEKIQSIAISEGLSYNNDNIKNLISTLK